MEAFEAAAERGYRGLSYLLSKRDEERILLVCHGGILRYTMNIHPLVHLCDERNDDNRQNGKSVESRFDNCEVRKYRLSWKDCEDNDDEGLNNDQGIPRKPIILTQIDH
jgi:broad specificity phosphatase PhoE